MNTSYRFQIGHFPDTGLIKLKLYEGTSLLHDVEVVDSGADRLRGGRLGVYCDSQQDRIYPGLRSDTGP